MNVNEKDWKLFRKLVPGWQEAFMERLNREYIELLSGDGFASEKFWRLEDRIKQDKRRPGVIMKMKRGDMEWNLRDLILDGTITFEDISDFSEETRSRIEYLVRYVQSCNEDEEESAGIEWTTDQKGG